MKIARTKNERIMFLSKCAVCDSKKSKFIKQQEASGLLGSLSLEIRDLEIKSLGIKTPVSKIPLVSHLLF